MLSSAAAPAISPSSTPCRCSRDARSTPMNDVTASDKATTDTPIVGRSVPRPALERFTRGRGVYVADIEFRDMLHVALARSPVAHAQILRIEVEEARQC